MNEPTARAVGVALLTALPVLLLGCAQPELQADAIVCASIDGTEERSAVIRSGDPLEVLVAFDSVPAGPGGVRLRADGLAQPGIVTFAAPTPTSAAAGMALHAPPRYQGCAAMAPAGLELRAPFPPRGKAWVWVSTDRPTRMRVRVGARTTRPLLVAPGASALVTWGDLE